LCGIVFPGKKVFQTVGRILRNSHQPAETKNSNDCKVAFHGTNVGICTGFTRHDFFWLIRDWFKQPESV